MSKIFTDVDTQVTQRIGVADLHSDLPLGLLKRRFDGEDGSLRTEWLPRLRAGGVRVVVCAVYIGSIFLPEGALRRAVQLVDALREEIATCADEIELAVSGADVERITGQGKFAAILALEGAEPLGQDLAALRLFYRLGMRMLSFAWMRRTAFGDGAWENDSRGGLTRLGIIADVSHASDQTTWDVLESSTQPVIASHSNVRAIRDHPRNLTDPMIEAIAASGGLVGVVAVAGYIADSEPTISHWADHVDHIVRLVGIDHVGIGCDFYDEIMAMGAAQEIPVWNPGGSLGQLSFTGMRSWADLPGLTAELLRRGYTEGDLRKIYYDNFSRVMGVVLSV